jgi:hypothetical protein
VPIEPSKQRASAPEETRIALGRIHEAIFASHHHFDISMTI